MTSAHPATELEAARVAPHGARTAAFLIDAACLVLPVGLFLVTDTLVGFGVSATVVVVGVAALVAASGALNGTLAWLTGGLTIGKAYCGLLVRRRDESPIRLELGDFGRMVGRHSLGYVVIDVVGLGNLLAARSPRRRALHDVVFDTEVVAVPGPADRWERVRAMETARQAGLARVEERWLWVLRLVRWSSWVPVKVAGAVVVAAQAVKLVSPAADPVTTASTTGMPTGAGLGPAGAAGVTAGTTAATGALVLGGLAAAGAPEEVGVSFQHAGFEYSVLEVNRRSHPPGEEDAEVDPDPAIDHLMLHTRMVNPGVSTNAVRFSQVPAAETWSLELDDGTVVPSEGLEELGGQHAGFFRGVVPFDDDVEFWMSFPVPSEEQVDDPALRVHLFDYEPTVVALTGGDQNPRREPVEVLTPTYTRPMGGWGSIELELRDAWASREAGVDEEETPLPAPDFGLRQRAGEGRVFVHFEVSYRPLDGEVILGELVPVVDGGAWVSEDDHAESEHANTERAEPQVYRAMIEVPVDAETVGIGFAASRGPIEFVAELDPGFLDEFRAG